MQQPPKGRWRTLLALLFLVTFTFLRFYNRNALPRRHQSSAPKGTRNATSSDHNTTDTTGVITLGTNGRLGDQMGGYATLYALAKLHGRKAYIGPSMHGILSPLFRITLPVLTEELRNVSWEHYYYGNWMSESYYHLNGKYVKLFGYFSAWTFFHQNRREIAEQFTFHRNVSEEAWSSLMQLREGRRNPTYVGVHVRRGDYVRKMRDVFKGVMADTGYFENAMSYFRSRYREVIFVVVSDGMLWCRERIDTSRGDVYFLGRHWAPKEDFAILAHCNHTIMTIGNFGFWAAYLAGGEATYLANHTLPDSPWLDSYRASARLLPHWIGIPANLTPILNTTEETTTPGGPSGWWSRLEKLWRVNRG